MNTDPDLNNATTEELIKNLVSSGLIARRELIEEIIKREDAPSHLHNLLKEDKHWEPEGEGNGWPQVHALFILGLIGNDAAFNAIKYTLNNRTEELGDWICEDAGKILYAFGKNFFGKIAEITLDRATDKYARLAALDAICAMAATSKELTPKAAEICKKILEDEDNLLVALALPAMAEIKEDALFELIKQAHHKIPDAKGVTDMADPEELHARTSDMPIYTRTITSPWKHFSKEYLMRFHEKTDTGRLITREEDGKKHKAGRNDACPCGSGKKYKRCCLSTTQ